MSIRALSLLVLALGCGGAQHHEPLPPTPPPATNATLAGPLCEGQACRCRTPEAPGDAGAGVPAEGMKRFELRLGPTPNPLWVTVDGSVLYKSEEHALDCFYVDLAPGDHQVSLRAGTVLGMSARLTIREYGVAAESWYDTFEVGCGSPGACSDSALDAEKRRIAGVSRGIHDPCGSVKVKSVTFDSSRAPDSSPPTDLAASFVLDVYDFAPDKPSGSAGCTKR